MNLKIEKIPYYIVKALLLALGIGEVANYWAEKKGYKIVVKNLKWADQDYAEYDRPLNQTVKTKSTIWVYWKQGFDNAPEIIKKCLSSIMKHKGYREVVLLTEQNISDYVRLPFFVEDKHKRGIISEAHYSDMIRLQLLLLYGGIWMDATCFCTAEVPDNIENADLFMFSSGDWWPWMFNPSKCSNWYIKSSPNNIILTKVRNFLFEHWRLRNTPLHYYVFHYALSALVANDTECARHWKNVPFISNLQPHLLRYSFFDNYDEQVMADILSQCFVHKCTYKLKKMDEDIYAKSLLKEFLN